LWYVMSLAGTLLILVAMFTNRWLEGHASQTNLSSAAGIGDAMLGIANNLNKAVRDNDINELADALKKDVGLFMDCTEVEGRTKVFPGECIPSVDSLKQMFDVESLRSQGEKDYPHAWRGAVICFVLGLLIMILTDLFALLTICCRRCICCSVFTVCGSLQSCATILFTLGLIAYPAGWGSDIVKNNYCAGSSSWFILGDVCELGFAFWLAVAGTVCTMLASSLAIWAYQSTRSSRCEERIDQGEKYICLP